MADMMDPSEVGDMVNVTIADLHLVRANEGQGIAISTALALMYAAAAFLCQMVGPEKVADSVRHLLEECEAGTDLAALAAHDEARH